MSLVSECCLRPLDDNERYCPRCGWECRVMDPRPAGIYCRWETWPPTPEPGDNVVHVPGVPGGHRQEFTETILHIERVGGDGSVRTFECGRSESEAIFY